MKRVSLRVVTINILNDLSHWEARRSLLVQGLAAVMPDLVTLQEVSLGIDNAGWLAGQLGFDYLYISPKLGSDRHQEGIAILSRLPFVAQDTLDLLGQGRVAQCVQIRGGDHTILFANGHLFWQPGDSETRLNQVRRLLAWLGEIRGEHPVVICGDFNGTPETQAIQEICQQYASAYASIHGTEPAYTCPTPRKRSFLSQLNTLRSYFMYLRPQHINPFWRGTLDYIFVDPRLQVKDCQIILNMPSLTHINIYPSDHFGLYAELDTGVL